MFKFLKNDLFQVDMSKVALDTIKPWINEKVTEILGMEDDVVIEFVYNQLDERVKWYFYLFIIYLKWFNMIYLQFIMLNSA